MASKPGRRPYETKARDNPDLMALTEKSRLKEKVKRASIIARLKTLVCVGGGPGLDKAPPFHIKFKSNDGGYGFWIHRAIEDVECHKYDCTQLVKLGEENYTCDIDWEDPGPLMENLEPFFEGEPMRKGRSRQFLKYKYEDQTHKHMEYELPCHNIPVSHKLTSNLYDKYCKIVRELDKAKKDFPDDKDIEKTHALPFNPIYVYCWMTSFQSHGSRMRKFIQDMRIDCVLLGPDIRSQKVARPAPLSRLLTNAADMAVFENVLFYPPIRTYAYLEQRFKFYWPFWKANICLKPAGINIPEDRSGKTWMDIYNLANNSLSKDDSHYRDINEEHRNKYGLVLKAVCGTRGESLIFLRYKREEVVAAAAAAAAAPPHDDDDTDDDDDVAPNDAAASFVLKEPKEVEAFNVRGEVVPSLEEYFEQHPVSIKYHAEVYIPAIRDDLSSFVMRYQGKKFSKPLYVCHTESRSHDGDLVWPPPFGFGSPEKPPPTFAAGFPTKLLNCIEELRRFPLPVHTLWECQVYRSPLDGQMKLHRMHMVPAYPSHICDLPPVSHNPNWSFPPSREVLDGEILKPEGGGDDADEEDGEDESQEEQKDDKEPSSPPKKKKKRMIGSKKAPPIKQQAVSQGLPKTNKARVYHPIDVIGDEIADYIFDNCHPLTGCNI